MENEVKQDILTRKQLYDEIWKMSVAGVARKYNLDYTKLMATCKNENIPYPSSGYWTKKNYEKDVSGEIVELSGDANKEILLGLLRISSNQFFKGKQDNKKSGRKIVDKKILPEQGKAVEIWDAEDQHLTNISLQLEERKQLLAKDCLMFLDNDERIKVLSCAQNIRIEENARLHKVLVQYKKELSEFEKKSHEVQKNSYYNSYRTKSSEGPTFFREMSDDGKKRAFAILDALFKSIETLGGHINDDLTVKIREDIVKFHMAESQDQVKHELTKQEAQQLLEYNDKVKYNQWASKPQIRKYDKVYNGKLRIIISERNYIRDNASEKLEERLGDILIALYEKSEDNRIAREAKEAETRRRREEEQLREERRKRKEQEIQKVIELANKADDYRIANEIRAYITAAIESDKVERNSEWVQWANRKADWYDPIIAYDDELLGKRDHGKSKEEKEKTLNDSVRKSWYW